ncbi:class I SAM-dependent methyltransferase [Kocuria salsicia]|uniref:class I SAM-dependent methyltransferase n=1 Tax=Kocuria salsicia TaxID=664639 RepID=UPI0011A61D04|nr:class I SAM-dependent methyltransferase [Kocuria salsicia]
MHDDSAQHAEQAMNTPELLTSVYDHWYHRMWAAEHGGARFEQEIADLIGRLPQIDYNRRVIDLGAGFGRISNALAERGYEVTGVEIADELRAIAAADAAANGLTSTFVGGDWHTFTAEQPAAAVLLWGTTYGHGGDEGDAATLATAHGLLAPGGVLLIELRNWGAPVRSFEFATHRSSDGAELFELHDYDVYTSTQHTRQTLVHEGRVVKQLEYSLRRYALHEILADCRAAGFAEVDATEVGGGRVTPSSQRIVVRAIRG